MNNEYIICTPVMLRAPKGEGSIVMYNNELNNLAIRKGNLFEHKGDWNTQHLYLVSDEEIKEGGVYLAYFPNKAPEIHIRKDGLIPTDAGRKKVVATTDKSLSLPLIPNSFMEEWVAKQGKIDKVKIKGAIASNGDFIPYWKFPEKEVIILPIEDKNYSREDMALSFLAGESHSASKQKGYKPKYSSFNEWFDKHY